MLLEVLIPNIREEATIFWILILIREGTGILEGLVFMVPTKSRLFQTTTRGLATTVTIRMVITLTTDPKTSPQVSALNNSE